MFCIHSWLIHVSQLAGLHNRISRYRSYYFSQEDPIQIPRRACYFRTLLAPLLSHLSFCTPGRLSKSKVIVVPATIVGSWKTACR